MPNWDAKLQASPHAPVAQPLSALHARKLAFAHPITDQALSFESELPADLAEWLAGIE